MLDLSTPVTGARQLLTPEFLDEVRSGPIGDWIDAGEHVSVEQNTLTDERRTFTARLRPMTPAELERKIKVAVLASYRRALATSREHDVGPVTLSWVLSDVHRVFRNRVEAFEPPVDSGWEPGEPPEGGYLWAGYFRELEEGESRAL